MINPSIVRAANRIRRRYAEYFADLPHVRCTSNVWFPATRSLAYPLAAALQEARAMDRAADLGLTCTTEPEDHTWDGDTEPPTHHLWMIVRDASGEVRASLGGIGVDSLSDPYLATCEAELYAEAIEAIEVEREAETYEAAAVLATRATYAGPSPEVCK